MTDIAWSHVGADDCIRIADGVLAEPADVAVRAVTSSVRIGLPPMAGRVVRDGGDLCFVPRYPFLDATSYQVLLNGSIVAELERLLAAPPATTGVAAIFPTAPEVPRNLLRFYIWFSAPMSRGDISAGHVRLVDDDGVDVPHVFMPATPALAGSDELWDPTRKRVTVLLDPARIKRGLVGNRRHGYPLQVGQRVWLVVEDEVRDARGARLRAPVTREYRIGADERRRIEPAEWGLHTAPAGTTEPFVAHFDRPLDHALAARCLRVTGPDGRGIAGTVWIGADERSWEFRPSEPWTDGPHQLEVDPIVEDLAGNSVERVFDRELGQANDDPRSPGTVTLAFQPS